MHTHHRTHGRRPQQRGIALLEALIAALVVAAGALALIWLQGELRYSADIARQRTEAARLAQADVEQLRGFVAIDAAAGTPAWSEIADAALDVTPTSSPTAYRLIRVVTTDDALALKAVRVELRWSDRRGHAQQFSLDTLIAGHDPALGGALALARPAFARP